MITTPYFGVKPFPTTAGGSAFGFLAGRGLSEGLFSMASNGRDASPVVSPVRIAPAGGAAGAEAGGVVAGILIFGDVVVGPGTGRETTGSIGDLGIPSR